ncbi:MAG TPA: HD domain-containing protein [Flavisolibacter sp.]|nr:HD domain-containing protein [Flavisolibacter sp.]
MINIDKIQKHVIEKLQDGLPQFLSYHNTGHTLDVLKQSMNIAADEGISSRNDLLLLQTGALYHDVGFIEAYNGHEEKSCAIAQRELGAFGFTQSQIDVICGMIMATRIPQSPHNILEMILCDADLDYLGRTDFYAIGNGLYNEFLHQHIVSDETDWNQLQVGFLERHRYFTRTSRQKREQFKQQHLEEIRKKLAVAG